MGSIIDRPGGARAIQFTGPDGNRKTLGLGKCTREDAGVVLRHLEAIASAKRVPGFGVPERSLAWLSECPVWLTNKLAALGLTEGRKTATVGGFIDEYINLRKDVEESTRTVWKRARRNIVGELGENTPMDRVTRADAQRLRISLGQTLSTATARRTIGIARQFFAFAQRDRIIDSNPFDGIPAAVSGNPERRQYIDLATFETVLSTIRESSLRSVFALARLGGLRVPSECLALVWGDVNEQAGTILVHARKTKRYEGKDRRVIPLIPRLAKILSDHRKTQHPTEPRVLPGLSGSVNLRTELLRAIKRAGLEPWPSLFVNLRASFTTDMRAAVGDDQAALMLGHDPRIAAAHYLTPRPDSLAKARSALQNRCMNDGEPSGTELHGVQSTYGIPLVFSSMQLGATPFLSVLDDLVGPAGTERNAPKALADSELQTVEELSAADSLSDRLVIKYIAARWGKIPTLTRLAILGLVSGRLPVPL